MDDNEQVEKDAWMFYRGSEIDFAIPDDVTGPIHVIGDSHVNTLLYTFPKLFKGIYHSITSYGESSDPTGESNGLADFERSLPVNSKVLSFFGEIDCRYYIPGIAQAKNETVEKVTEEIAEGYAKITLMFLKNKGHKVIVVGPHVCPNDLEGDDCRYEDILLSKIIYNEYLKKFCNEQGMRYIPLFSAAFKNKWHRKSLATYFNDSTHIGPCMIPVIIDNLRGF